MVYIIDGNDIFMTVRVKPPDRSNNFMENQYLADPIMI